jgi:hypothetical protein
MCVLSAWPYVLKKGTIKVFWPSSRPAASFTLTLTLDMHKDNMVLNKMCDEQAGCCRCEGRATNATTIVVPLAGVGHIAGRRCWLLKVHKACTVRTATLCHIVKVDA